VLCFLFCLDEFFMLGCLENGLSKYAEVRKIDVSS